jgi:hypothetical protein
MPIVPVVNRHVSITQTSYYAANPDTDFAESTLINPVFGRLLMLM